MVPEHLRLLAGRVRTVAMEPPPAPWLPVGHYAIGGLTDVGFGPDSEHLLVISWSGRGVYDCTTGERVARDKSMDGHWQDCFGLEAKGIGPLADQTVRTAGLFGGGLPLTTRDGWRVERLTLDWPKDCLILVPPGASLFGDQYVKPTRYVKVAVEADVRAWGFSPSGKTLVLATNGELTVFKRP
ncbi:MAG TPA: hypothetical protein VGF55_07090 [Gemmataceae bacterium]|jgi:hypothetical protein